MFDVFLHEYIKHTHIHTHTLGIFDPQSLFWSWHIVLVLTPDCRCFFLPTIEHVATASVKRLRSPCCHILFKDNLRLPNSLFFCISMHLYPLFLSLPPWDNMSPQESWPHPQRFLGSENIIFTKTKWKKLKSHDVMMVKKTFLMCLQPGYAHLFLLQVFSTTMDYVINFSSVYSLIRIIASH